MKQFVVLYTHQLTKKAKVWQDGTLRFPDPAGSRGLLYDDKNNRIDVLHVRASQLEPGSELQADRHLIQVEEVMTDTLTDTESQTVTAARSSTTTATLAAGAASGGVVKTGTQGPAPALGAARSGLSKKRKGFVPPRPSKRAFLSQCTESPPPRSPEPSPPTPNPLGTFPDLYTRVGQNHRNPQLESEIREEASSLLNSGLFKAFSEQKDSISPSMKPSGSKWGKFTDADETCFKSESDDECEDSKLDALLGPSRAGSPASKWAEEKKQSLKPVKHEPSIPAIDPSANSESHDINVASISVGSKWGKFTEDEIENSNLDSEDEMMPMSGPSRTKDEKPHSVSMDFNSVNGKSPVSGRTVSRSIGNKWGKFTDEHENGNHGDSDEDSQIDALLGRPKSLDSNSVQCELPVQKGLVKYDRELMVSQSPKPHVNSTSVRPSDESFEISEVPFWLLEGSGDVELTQLENDADAKSRESEVAVISQDSDCDDEIKVEVGDGLILCKVIADDSEPRIENSQVSPLGSEIVPESWKADSNSSEAICHDLVEGIVLQTLDNCCSLDSKFENFSTLESESVIPETPQNETLEPNEGNSGEPRTSETNNELSKTECVSPSYSPRLDISSDISISLDDPSQITESLDYQSILKEDKAEIIGEEHDTKDTNSKVINSGTFKLETNSCSTKIKIEFEALAPKSERNAGWESSNAIDCVKQNEKEKKDPEIVMNSMLDRIENQTVDREFPDNKNATENSPVEQSEMNEVSAVGKTEKKGNTLRGEFPTFDLFSSPLIDDILDWDLYGSPVEEVKPKTADQTVVTRLASESVSESEKVESEMVSDVEMQGTKSVTDVDKMQIIQDNSETMSNWIDSNQKSKKTHSEYDRTISTVGRAGGKSHNNNNNHDRLVPQIVPEVGIDVRIHGTEGSGTKNRKRHRSRGDPYDEISLVPVRNEPPIEEAQCALGAELDTSTRNFTEKRHSRSSENGQSLVPQAGSVRKSESMVSSAYPNVEKLFSKIAPPRHETPTRREESTERLKSLCDVNWSEMTKMAGSQCSSVARRRPEGLYRKLGLATPVPPNPETPIPRPSRDLPTTTQHQHRSRNVLDDLVPTNHDTVLGDVTRYPPITPRDDYDVMHHQPTRMEGRYDDISRQPITRPDRRDVEHYGPIPRQDHPDVMACHPITRPDYYDVRTEQPIKRQQSEHSLTRNSRQTSDPGYSDYHISQSRHTDPLPRKVDYDVNHNNLFADNFEESTDMNEVRQRISADFEKCEQANAFDSFTGNERSFDYLGKDPMGFGDDVRIDTYRRSREVPQHSIRTSNFDDVIPDEPIRARQAHDVIIAREPIRVRDAEQEVLDLEAYLGPDYDDILDSSCDSDRSFNDKQSQHYNIHSQNSSKPMTSVERTLKSVSTPSRWTKFVHHEIVERPTPLPYKSLSSGTSAAGDPPAGASGVAQRRPGGFKPPTRVAPGPLPAGPGRSTGSVKSVSVSGDLYFPSESELSSGEVKRQTVIPVTFTDVNHYKRTLVAAIREYLNMGLRQLARTYHAGLSRVDTQDYIKAGGSRHKQKTSGPESEAPCCEHGTPAKMVQVRKEGPNKGRFFYSCNSPRDQQCKFFKWADLCEGESGTGRPTVKKVALLDHSSISSYVTKLGVPFYCECSFLRRSSDARIDDLLSKNKYRRASERQNNTKKRLYLHLSRREKSDTYAKNDLWIISRSLHFDRGETFLARSVYFGPNTNNEVEIEPLSGYSPSNWQNKAMCHAIQACNASSELTTITNIQDHIQARAPPLVNQLLNTGGGVKMGGVCKVGGGRGFQTPALMGHSGEAALTEEFVTGRADVFVIEHRLNPDQAEALRRVGRMLVTDPESEVCLVQGVFGAGKSFLLAVMILYLVDLFTALNQRDDEPGPDRDDPWRILVSSTTNVAVDRILQWLLELGFSDFVRVGSVKKIAKTVLPYSVHAFGSESQELKELKEMDKTELSAQERGLIRRSIEHHKLGLNRKKLSSVLVVGATCAACPFPCMDKMKFPVVVLDECSQMTEPASLLPVARFMAKRLVLVGDPQQLGPTLQGCESEHENGLEQTLFDRLLLMPSEVGRFCFGNGRSFGAGVAMVAARATKFCSEEGHESVLLRTQYRCHPRISGLASHLFYRGKLLDGVNEEDRPRIVPALGPAVFLDVARGREACGYDGSYYNDAEVSVCVRLIGVVLEELEPGSVGVITLYKNQAAKLSAALRESGLCRNQRDVRAIQVSTVDAFQGAERDVIILSCVRTDHVGFIDSDKRTNVALTRARNHLVIVGHRRNLNTNPLWSRVIDYCADSRDGLHDAEQFLSRFRSEATT